MENALCARLLFFHPGALRALPHTGDSCPSARFFSPSLEGALQAQGGPVRLGLLQHT